MYPKANEKVLIYTPYENEIPGFKYGFEKLQSEGVIDKDATVDVLTFESFKDNPSDAEQTLRDYAKNYDYIIAVSEIGRAGQLSKGDWLAEIPDMLTTFAKENNKKSTIISIGKPYDLDRYKNSDAHVLAYGSKGMDPTEKGKDPVKTFGPNIPFSLDVVFGKVASTGKLPVDVPGLNENYEYTDEIAYKIGYGLETKIKSDDKKDSENINKDKNESEKPILEKKQVKKTNPPKDAKKVDNPGTGVSGLASIVATLFTASTGLVLSRKK